MTQTLDQIPTAELQRRRTAYIAALGRTHPAANADDIAWWLLLTERELVARTQRRCETCGGHGQVPGAVRQGSTWQTTWQPCPSCTAKVAA